MSFCSFFRWPFWLMLIISMLLGGFRFKTKRVRGAVIIKDAAGMQIDSIEPVDFRARIVTQPDFYYGAIPVEEFLGWPVAHIDSILWHQRLGSPDPTRYYIDGYDTTYHQESIQCDTIPFGFELDVGGRRRFQATLDCDTTYVQRITARWAQLKPPLLRPDQTAKLLQMLSEWGSGWQSTDTL